MTASPPSSPSPDLWQQTWHAPQRWRRLAVRGLAALLSTWLLAWLGLPPLLKGQIESRASEALGRSVTVTSVAVRPWSLEVDLAGLRIASTESEAPPLLTVDRVHVDAELQSLLRLAPVIDALRLERPVVHVSHLADGRYSFDDIVERLRAASPPPDPQAEPARFALFNLAVQGGAVTFEDRPVGVTHRIEAIELGVPFLSNLESRRDVVTQPRLAFRLNGSEFDSSARTTPFADTHATQARLQMPAFDVAPYLPYWPAALPVRPLAGVLDIDLTLDFEQKAQPQVRLSGSVGVSGLRVAEAGRDADAAWLGWERLQVALESVQPLARQVALGPVTLDGLRLAIDRDAQGRTSLQRMADRLGAPAPAAPAAGTGSGGPAAAPAPWQFRMASFELKQARIDWRDAATRPATAVALTDLQLRLGSVAWPAMPPAAIEVVARLADVPLTLKGEVSDTQARLQLGLQGWPLAAVSSYMQQVLVPEVTGSLTADLALEWDAAREEQPMAARIQGGRLALEGLRVGPARQPLAQWKALELTDVQLAWPASRLALGGVRLEEPRVQAGRDAEGRWMFESWLRERPASVPAAPTAAAAWQVTVGDLQIQRGGLRWTDRLPARPVDVVVSGLDLKLQNLAPMAASQPDMPLNLQARVAAADRMADAGRLSVNGQLRLPSAEAGLRARTRLQVERLPLHALEPYFGERLAIDLLRADASLRGQLDLELAPAGPRVQLAADAALEDLQAHSLAPAEELLSWKSLQVRGVQLRTAPGEALQLAVAETVLSDYYARVIIDPEGRINLQGLVKPAPGEPVAAADPSGTANATATPSAPPATPPATEAAGPVPDIRFGPVSLVNGRVLFSDRFIRPNYTANLSELTGTLSAFASRPAAPGEPPALADLSLKGRAEGTAALDIGGRINPLARPLALDVQARVRDLELPPLSPYSAKYAGYGIERGKLSVDLAYRVDPDGQLSASNQIVLNQLSFGERIEGSTAPNLPVKLAVALLADRNGVIDINLPISGSLNDPQFRLGPIIVKLIFNLIGKAITAPFALIAGAFAGDGPDMSQVGFVPGSAVIGDEAQRQLEGVAKALASRPALQLTVVGHSDLEAERSGYQRARLDAQVQAEKRRQLARSGAAVPPTLTVGAQEYPELLKEVYRRADVPKPRNLIGMAKDIPVADMEKLLMAAIPVNDDALRELAVARAVAVKDFLASRSVPEDRLFLGAPRLKAAGEGWKPQAELRLAPR